MSLYASTQWTSSTSPPTARPRRSPGITWPRSHSALQPRNSTYYRWRQAETEPCERRRRDAELTGRIRQVHDESGGIYGSPRVHAVLRREGVHVGRKRVERLMRQAGLAGISPRRDKGFTRRGPDADLAPDLVQRDFTANGPNRLRVTDLTMISTEEGPLWLSAIRDAFTDAGERGGDLFRLVRDEDGHRVRELLRPGEPAVDGCTGA
ncbi:IS3 family transposase [Streptomyces sp. TRM68367]|uniref:IS3 family transposase n=1 Tax=Streptomyces sp. TRM68367 TaxID=2758415 RepID=UPI00165C6022|nr:IS3 family transposase [Streptomyces sp. TRM68367]MBC9731083.1 IS3 family transposase [Streptomyces sp. TRM68367]